MASIMIGVSMGKHEAGPGYPLGKRQSDPRHTGGFGSDRVEGKDPKIDKLVEGKDYEGWHLGGRNRGGSQ
jgi:hypothetical protein